MAYVFPPQGKGNLSKISNNFEFYPSQGFPGAGGGGGGSWDFEDDFTTDKSWAATGTKMAFNAGTDVIDWDGAQDGSTHGITKDLQDADALNGSNASDTAWVFRVENNISTLTAPSSASNRFFIGLTDLNHATAGDANQDGFGILVQNDTGTNVFGAVDEDGGSVVGAYQAFADVPAVGDYGYEIIRTSATAGTAELFTDNTYSSSIEQEILVIASTTASLRYLALKMRSSASVGGTFDGTVDDVFFADGVTSAP